MSLLDTVEPDIYAAIPILGGHTVEDAYFRPKVESLLSQCRKEARKEVWLEAIKVCDEKIASYEYLASGETMDDQKTRVLNRRLGALSVREELRRMAESDKTTMEGEK